MRHSLGTLLVLLVLNGGLGGLWTTHASAVDTDLVYRLKWLKNMSTVGDLYAEAHGGFTSRGLKVSIKPGGPEIDTIRELELGQADFGVASADQVIRALSKGAPVVVVAQLFQVNPLQWIYRGDKISIEQLTDLKGRTLGVTFGKNDEIIMRTLLSRAQIRENQVRLFSVRLDYTPFYKGVVDLWPVYINTQGVEIGGKLTASGENIRFFNPNDHGVRFVANSVVTSRKMIERSSATVDRFVCALIEAWDQAMAPANAPRAISVVQRHDRDTAPRVLEQQLRATRKLTHPNTRTITGAIDQDAWQTTEDIMLTHQQIPGPVHVVRQLYSAKCK